MSAFLIFTKKEIIEQIKNYKILILFAVLILFGIMSPVLAKMTPEIIKSVGQGYSITVPEPTTISAYEQFFSNMIQMCIIVILLVFGNNISSELSKGTAAVMFSKGLSRTAFVLSKVAAMLIIWTVGYALSAAACYYYASYLFQSGWAPNLLYSLMCLWLLVVFIISVITIMSSIFKRGYVPLLLTVGILFVMMILNSFSNISKYSPLGMGTFNLELLNGAKDITYTMPSLFITIALTLILIFGAVKVFKHRQV